MFGKRRLILFAALGALAGLGQAPWDYWWITLVVLAAVFWLRTADAPRKAFSEGWALGAGYFALTLHWIVEPFLVAPEVHGWMAPFAIVFMSGGLALFWGAAFAAAARWTRGALGLVLMLTLAEVLRAYVFTGFPWVLLGHIWISTPLGQITAVAGPHGLTLMTLALAGMLTVIAGTTTSIWIVLIAPTTIAMLWGAFAPGPPEAVEPDAPLVRLVQPNAPQNEKWDPDRAPVFYARMLEFSRAGQVPDLIVWPETAIPYLLDQSGPVLSSIAQNARGAPVVLGANRRENGRYYNTMSVIDPDGTVSAQYDKQHLVPFGEYIPAGELARRIGISGLAASQGGGFSAGQGGQLIDLAGIGAARPLICYEGIFAEELTSDLTTRPDLMLMITNDAWFGGNAGPKQHFAAARLRAIEQGLPMVRVANTGISAMIDGRGRVIDQLELGTEGWVDVPLPRALPATLYSRYGDWPIVVLLIFASAALIVRRRQYGIDPDHGAK